jgi:hypothetical protein
MINGAVNFLIMCKQAYRQMQYFAMNWIAQAWTSVETSSVEDFDGGNLS